MYQALYRKYRPKTLEDICGQEAIVKIIKNSILNNKISHAYLFAGPRGTGKTSLAKVFSKIVNCENPIDCKPCGKCVNCTQINNSDIIEIDAASNNGVDEIRELRSKVNLVPSYGKYKIYIIDEVHMLTTGAFNALLKTLEEPPAHIIFILATTDPHKIPETIISRCQRLDFKKISLEAIVNRLRDIAEKENIQIEDSALKEIAILSDGGMRDSLGMLDEAASYTSEKITEQDIHDINGTLTKKDLVGLVEMFSKNDLENVLKTFDNYNSKGKNFVKLTEEIILFMRDLLMYKKAPKYFSTVNNNTDLYKDINITSNLLIKYIEELNDCIINMKTTNNPKLMLELSIIKMVSKDDLNLPKENNSQNISREKTEVTQAKIIPAALSKPVEKDTENPSVKKESKPIEKEREIKKEDNPALGNSVDKVDNEKLEKLKTIRIDNTLAHFNKKHLLEMKKILDKVQGLLLDPDYGKSASMVMDGTLKAASEENLIFMYKTRHLSNLFNENLIMLEKTIEKVCGKHYNVIAVSEEEWEKIKKEFNGKLRKFVYQKEDIKLEEIFSSQKDELSSLFGDIIEYS